MERGEVWLADLPPPIGERPVLLLSRNASSDRRAYVTVAQATTTVRRLRQEVHLTRAEGMAQECVVNLDDLQTIPKSVLRNRVTRLSDEKMDAVRDAIRYALAL